MHLGGYGPEDLPTEWVFDQSPEQNMAAGAMPQGDMLWWARLPMVVLAVTACLGSFLLMRRLFGAGAAYVGLALLACSPWIGTNVVRAMAEAPLVCSLLLVAAAATRLVVAANRGSTLPTQLLWLSSRDLEPAWPAASSSAG